MLSIKGKDRVERRVSAVVDAVRSGKRWRMLLAYKALSPIETGDVLAELFMMLEDITSGVDEAALLEAAKVPDAIDAPAILKAAADADLVGLMAAAGAEHLEGVFAKLFVLAAALKDASAHLDADKT
jgi:hypothetical protein